MKKFYLTILNKNKETYQKLTEDIIKNRSNIKMKPTLIVVGVGGGVHIFVGAQKTTTKILDVVIEDKK